MTLAATVRLQELLSHLYVLIPVLDNDKHYYVGHDEVEKLPRQGAGWLATHPDKEFITQRYLRHQRTLQRAALVRLVAEETPQVEEVATAQDAEEATIEERVSDRKITLHEQRLKAVLAVLEERGAQRVLDLGCGEGRLLALLLAGHVTGRSQTCPLSPAGK